MLSLTFIPDRPLTRALGACMTAGVGLQHDQPLQGPGEGPAAGDHQTATLAGAVVSVKYILAEPSQQCLDRSV